MDKLSKSRSLIFKTVFLEKRAEFLGIKELLTMIYPLHFNLLF